MCACSCFQTWYAEHSWVRTFSRVWKEDIGGDCRESDALDSRNIHGKHSVVIWGRSHRRQDVTIMFADVPAVFSYSQILPGGLAGKVMENVSKSNFCSVQRLHITLPPPPKLTTVTCYLFSLYTNYLVNKWHMEGSTEGCYNSNLGQRLSRPASKLLVVITAQVYPSFHVNLSRWWTKEVYNYNIWICIQLQSSSATC